ncbi:hypothetical protein NIES4075_34480 [Tolypothrix sp. NIES-4075]|nr:hypothetical protein NIES4075_34480 [Tolypothrix sp. NIES-4075]
MICFDELDTLEVDDNGFLASQIIASLAKDLYNSLKRGVILLAMYPETWTKYIYAMPEAAAIMDRLVSEQPDRQPIQLKNLNSDDILALVRQWLQEFYQENQQIPPHPLYPFDETKLRELGKSRPTVRAVLRWCADNFVEANNIHPVEPYFQSELANVEASINSLLENEKEISSALWLAFNTLVGETVEKVKIENIQEVKASGSDQGYIDFRIVGNSEKIKIGVDVLQESGGKYVGAALKRLIDYKKFDLTRGCLIRSKKINSGAAVPRECVRKLLKELGGEWVMLQSQDIKPLLAILFVYENCENYQITEQEIFDFIKENKLAIDNPLIREILSDPSGQEPDNLTDDELPMRIPQTVTNYIDNIEVD